MDFLVIFSVTFLWLGVFKENILFQGLSFLISTALSFYLYCVIQMEQYKQAINEYDDKGYEYLENENNTIEQIAENAKNVDKISTKDGEIAL